MDAFELKKYIYDNSKIEYILEQLECVHIKHLSKEYRCGLPNDTNYNRVCVKNIESLKTTVYKSSDSTLRGDIITLIMDIKSLSFSKAIKLTHLMLGLPYKYQHKEIKKNTTPLDIFQKYKHKHKLEHNINDIETCSESRLMEYIPLLHISWLREGIISKIAREFNIGFDAHTNRIIIPHRKYCGDDNEYVGIIGRSVLDSKMIELLDIPKYFPLVAYPKGLNLYGLQENYKYIQEQDIVYVGESEKYVLKNASRGMRDSVGLCCHDVTDEQIRILIGLDVTEIVIDLDKGISEYHIWSICDRLYGIRKVSYVWDKYDILEDKESSSDKPLKVNQWLRKNRIEYTAWHRRQYYKEREKRMNGR